jgi:DNA-binding winged helix-turn-helix (wHTH) protein/TolB-like protein
MSLLGPESRSGLRGGPAPCLAFGPFELDPSAGILREGGRAILLDGKPFELLLYLAHHPGRVVSRRELLDLLWPEGDANEDAVVQCVVEVRRALGEVMRSPRYVRTVPRKGYLLAADVTPREAPETARPQLVLPFPTPAEAPRPPRVVPRPGRSRRRWRRAAPALAATALVILGVGAFFRLRPAPDDARALDADALVVMPVSVSEPRPESGYLRQGLPEMIRSQLGQTPGLRVLPRHQVDAALAEAGFTEDEAPSTTAATAVARKLGVERIITGSFVRVENRFVINAQLMNASTGRAEASASVRGQHPAQLLEAVDELTLRLLHHLQPPELAGSNWRPSTVSPGAAGRARNRPRPVLTKR